MRCLCQFGELWSVVAGCARAKADSERGSPGTHRNVTENKKYSYHREIKQLFV
ncbi:hypothetical protein Mapa_011401 [Marchantia paleacea]|nr:hypothetical protein Mapa_011401 [Marchantia paleacea]